MSQLNNKQIEWIEKQMREKFWFFVQSIMPPEWYDEKFHRELCEFLQYGGQRKLIILPRTHLKTTVCACFYPLWRASVQTGLRALEVSNTSPNAEKTVRSIRSIVETNKVYQSFFSECIPEFTKVRWSDRCACLARPEDYPEGTFESAGVGANIIRRHFNLIVEDDTVAPKKDDLSGEECMPSREDIEQAVGFHRLTPPLLINEGDEQLVVGTRWADYDHIGWIAKNEKYAIFDKPSISPDGIPLYKRFSRERIENIRLAMGTYLFNALYMNKPLAKEFMVFSPDWIQYYEQLPPEGDCVITVDPADPPTGKRTQDYTAIVPCIHGKQGIWVDWYIRERVSDQQMITKTLNMADTYLSKGYGVKIRIEVDRYAHLEFGFKQAMMGSDGQTPIRQWHRVECVKTKGKVKEARIRQRLQPMFESGVLKLRKNMSALEEELYTFPNGSHDDLIDALAWQIEGIHPTEFPDAPKTKKGRMLPTVDEMYESLMRKGGQMQYPFQRQLQQVGGGMFAQFDN